MARQAYEIGRWQIATIFPDLTGYTQECGVRRRNQALRQMLRKSVGNNVFIARLSWSLKYE